MSKVGAVALASVIAVAIGIAIGYGVWHGGSSMMNNGMMGGGMMGANGRRERSGPAPQSGAPTITRAIRKNARDVRATFGLPPPFRSMCIRNSIVSAGTAL